MNAIILAAGKGTRLLPLTLSTPKPLLPVNGIPIIEQQIQYLLDKGITEIHIVVGYLKEKFEYLKEKYHVNLVENPYYDTYNNLISLYVAKDYLKNSYIIEGDVYMRENVFRSDIKYSSYFSCNRNAIVANEWKLDFDANQRVESICIGSKPGDYILSGISFWNQLSCRKIRNYLCQYKVISKNKDLYWDHIILNHFSEFEIYIIRLSEKEIYEIDNLEEYYALGMGKG